MILNKNIEIVFSIDDMEYKIKFEAKTRHAADPKRLLFTLFEKKPNYSDSVLVDINCTHESVILRALHDPTDEVLIEAYDIMRIKIFEGDKNE